METFSFLQRYEDDHPSFLRLLDQLGTKIKQPHPIDRIKAKPIDKKIFQEIKRLNPTDIRQRVNSINRNKDFNNKNNLNARIRRDTIIFIDYGNIHHSLYQLKHKNPQLRNFTELDFLLSLKNKASMNNNVSKIKLYMGMPRITIKDLENMRSKKEKLISQLKKNDFEVYFTINENKFTGGMQEQGVDLRIAINIIHCALEDEFEKVILVSGDADFTNVIKKLRQLNKEIEIWSFTNTLDKSPLSPFLYKELTKDEKTQNGIKSLNAMFRC